jgi:Ca2+-binding RTX toxin-like protein
MKRTLLLLSTMTLAVLLASGVALAGIRVGTDNAETITGTNLADHITGKGGNDTLKGLAANDTYHFDNGFGDDTLTETVRVKVGNKRKPGGVDTLNFSHIESTVQAAMIPQWADPGVEFYNDVTTTNGDTIDLGTSPVENVVGGSGPDNIVGGPARNTLSGGPGGHDILTDLGGVDGALASKPGQPDLPASDDTYKGFTSGTGNDEVRDIDGAADKLDLRPLESSEIYFDDTNLDGKPANGNESLKVIINDATSVVVAGYFSPAYEGQVSGRVEQIIFSNETVTSTAELNSLVQEGASLREDPPEAR